MIRLVVLVVVGFLLGIGSATAYVVTREEPEPLLAYLTRDSVVPPADSLAVLDSIPSFSAPDSVAVAPVVGSPTTPEVPAAEQEPIPVVPEPLTADSVSSPPAPPARNALEQERVTAMFAAMKPQEAARVLEQLGDDEVRVLLSALSDRKAAAILSSLSPQRAAAISRPSLQTRSER